jgi:hypothetical protein
MYDHACIRNKTQGDISRNVGGKIERKFDKKGTEKAAFSVVQNTKRLFCSAPGLPDGFFSNQKFQFGKNFQGLRLENVNIFYGHSEYFMDIWNILLPFGTFCVHLLHFSSFGIMHQ